MGNKILYTVDEAQLIWTKIIKGKSNELKKDLEKVSQSNIDVKKITYV